MSVVAVIPVAVEESEHRLWQTISSAGFKDVVMVVDEDYPYSWLNKYGHVVRIQGFGVGKALEAGFRYAFRQLDADWVVRTDGHVVFNFKPSRIVDKLPREMVVLPTHWTPEGAQSRGLIIEPYTWEYKWNFEMRLVPMAMDPVFIVHRSLAEKLWSIQGECFPIPYWGKENFDFTLTLTRLGHPTQPIEESVVHLYKKEWPKERITWRIVYKRTAYEPWMEEIPDHENPLFFSMSIGDAIYAFRHYETPHLFPFWKNIPQNAVKIAVKYFPHKCRYLPLKPVWSVYKELGF